jgi:hypothetical protein
MLSKLHARRRAEEQEEECFVVDGYRQLEINQLITRRGVISKL